MQKIDIYWDLRSTLPQRHTGVGRHVIEVLSRLSLIAEIDLRVLLAKDQSALWPEQARAYGWESIPVEVLAGSNKSIRLLHGCSSFASIASVCQGRDFVYSPMEMLLHTGNVPFINTIHGIPCFETTVPPAVYHSLRFRWERLKQAWFLRRCRHLCQRSLVVSDYLGEQLQARFNFSPQHLHTVYNGASERFFEPPASKAHDTSAPAAFRFLTVGGANAFDGGEHLVKVSRCIHQLYPDASIHVVGDWHQEPWYSQLQAMPQVKWLGFLTPPALLQEMQDASVLLYLPAVESFGMIGVEAMAVGLPILANPETALPEVLAEAACWVDLQDESAIRAALQTVTEDQSARDAFVAQGRKRAEMFRWQRVVNRILQAFQSEQKACT